MALGPNDCLGIPNLKPGLGGSITVSDTRGSVKASTNTQAVLFRRPVFSNSNNFIEYVPNDVFGDSLVLRASGKISVYVYVRTAGNEVYNVLINPNNTEIQGSTIWATESTASKVVCNGSVVSGVGTSACNSINVMPGDTLYVTCTGTPTAASGFFFLRVEYLGGT